MDARRRRSGASGSVRPRFDDRLRDPMAELTPPLLHRVLSRFPWRRRKPRCAEQGRPPIGVRDHEGQTLWADPRDLATFEDPAPALLCAAVQGDGVARLLLRTLVHHHATAQGVPLVDGGPAHTRAGLRVLDDLLNASGLDPELRVGTHSLRDMLVVTWALAAATSPHTAD
jgi:hypothetical protein